ncbi:unnamed protein product [Auanema sp. JU1783]|nr:unnamed protein product [Auanema sp. JU1783]
MAKTKNNKLAQSSSNSVAADSETDKAISLSSQGYIRLRVHARPGAKQNIVTEIRDDEICIAINAPPREGQANEELVSYVREVLGLRNNELSFDKGAKSRNKVLLITSNRLSIEDVTDKLNEIIGK